MRTRTPAVFKPTVAIITPSLGLGGAEQWIRCLVTYCPGINWVVGVLSVAHWHKLIGDAVTAHATVHTPLGVDGNVVTHDTTTKIINATVKRANAVIVWGGGSYWPLPTSAPIVFCGHGTCQWTVKAAAEAKAAGASYFVSVSGKSAEAVKAVAPAVTTIWNGVDTSRLSPAKNVADVRTTWNPHAYSYTRYVGYLGRLGNEKNLDSLIYAMTSLPFHYHLVLIGCTGWKHERILKLARQALPERLIEVSATDQIGVPLSALDCMVQVSPREGHSLAICEGMLCGVPIISNRTGAIPELEATAGRDLVESLPDDPLTCEIAAAIRRVCGSFPAERVTAAAAFAYEHLTATVMCEKWERYLHGIIQVAARRRERDNGSDIHTRRSGSSDQSNT